MLRWMRKGLASRGAIVSARNHAFFVPHRGADGHRSVPDGQGGKGADTLPTMGLARVLKERWMKRLAWLWIVWLAGCQQVVGMDDYVFDRAEYACVDACGALEECGKNGCCVAKSVRLPGGFSIDATEVTWSQYETWLSKKPSREGQPEFCGWNNTYAHAPNCMNNMPKCQGASCDNLPVVCVDWCDAYAYCRAVGKRLCGKIGGGSVSESDFEDSSKGQWDAACSSGGYSKYVYGDKYHAGKCHDSGEMASEVGTHPDCKSPDSHYAGVLDLNGNVSEWEDSCKAYSGEDDSCRMRGGSIREAVKENNSCINTTGSQRDFSADNVGFRCCSKP
ncbi:MAG: Formylglycine-generating sulfatase enzyme [Deltaproteobacteria bacterium ADurb.Bin207]|nr:MAG: Formylglycine-generating sulfatase enzyme [Deltaproteobacteria bacterium ADurb.Bin207]